LLNFIHRSTIFAALFLAAACQTTTNIDDVYPLIDEPEILASRYSENQPITIYFPQNIATAVPVVVFNHGRPFRDVGTGTYRLSKSHPLVARLNGAGIAVAVPIRKGYFSSPGWDGERMPCNDPSASDFSRAATAARRDVVAATDYVRSLPRIDKSRVFVAGRSAGGFAIGVSLGELEGKIAGALFFNAGRCGKRGDLFNGIQYAEKLFSRAASASTMRVIFYASAQDDIVPPASTRKLYRAYCKARGSNCPATVFIQDAPGAGHGLSGTIAVVGTSVINFVLDGEPQ